MATTYTSQKPSYVMTVGDAYIVFIDEETGQPETTGVQLPDIKELTITPDASNNKIYASGKVRDVVNNTRGATLAVDMITLPDAVYNRMIGRETQGSTKVDVALPQIPEFCFGYTAEMSDGTSKYYWHPRCKATVGEESLATSDDSDIDPELSVEFEAMPTDEGVWKIGYYPGDHGATALTAAQFFAAAPITKAEAAAIGA